MISRGFRCYRTSVSWLSEECASIADGDLAGDRSVRLVALLAAKDAATVAADVQAARSRRARVLAAVREAAASGKRLSIAGVAGGGGNDWRRAKRDIEELVSAGEVVVVRRRGRGTTTVAPTKGRDR